ncbi:hypothetical protein D3C85_407540 [compost metagenome]
MVRVPCLPTKLTPTRFTMDTVTPLTLRLCRTLSPPACANWKVPLANSPSESAFDPVANADSDTNWRSPKIICGMTGSSAACSFVCSISGSGNSGTKPRPSVGKPMTGSSAPAVSPNKTNEWPPPPPAPPEPGPAAVAARATVGSTPASMAACSCSTSVRSLSLGAVCPADSGAAAPSPRIPASTCVSSIRLLSRPSVSSPPPAKAMATAPPAPVTSCSPANTRSPSTSGRRIPSPATAKTSPTT